MGDPLPTPSPVTCPVVGLLGSAGALEALQSFFKEIPARPGLAFLVLQHLPADQPSHLADLLARVTPVPVHQARAGERVLPDQVLVVPAGMTLAMLDGQPVIIREDGPGLKALPGNLLFSSMAQALEDRAIAIVLSGTGRDGTVGLGADQAQGGLALVQDPATAAYGAMPRACLEAGVTEWSLAPAELAVRVLQEGTAGKDPAEAPSDPVAEICAALARRTGHDFAGYKAATLQRRILRRMRANGVRAAQAYLDLLEVSAEEGNALLKDLLISVTEFFRNPDAFDSLVDHLEPLLLEDDGVFRVWVPGCATGEEAYSLAILLTERLERLGSPRPLKVFATDIDSTSLMHAKAGRYPAEALKGLAPGRRERFFVEEGGQFRVAKAIRERCVFSYQDLLRDPPFSGLHLVSCRNVFIYLQPPLQRRLVPLFHFALKPRGVLFLGTSEGPAGQTPWFEALDQGNRVFQRREVHPRPALEFPVGDLRLSTRSAGAAPGPGGGPAQASATGLFERMLLEDYVPASALVNELGDILYCAGRIGRYLNPAMGAPSTNLLQTADGPLNRELRRLLTRASTRSGLERASVLLRTADGEERLRVTVRPLPGLDREAGIYAVVLAREPGTGDGDGTLSPATPESTLLEQLDLELRATRVELQVTVEELESTNEELRSSNEELQSSNEELQASQEELESVNEELARANQELQEKIGELNDANSDLNNLLVATEIATIFLDRNLAISRFTPAATELFDLRDHDLGRPISALVPQFTGVDLPTLAREVLASHEVREATVRSREGSRWYMLRLRPYRTLSHAVAGVVATFVDITESHLAQLQVAEKEARYRNLFENMTNGYAHCRMRFEDGRPADYQYLSVNGAFRTQTRLPEVTGRWISEIVPGIVERDAALFERLGRVVRTGVPERFEVFLASLGDWFDITVYRPAPDEFVAVFDVITGRKQMEAALQESEARYRGMFETSEAVMLILDPHLGTILDANPAAVKFYGWPREQLIGRNIETINLLDPERIRQELGRVTGGASTMFEFHHRLADGRIRDVEVYPTAVPLDGRMRIYSIIHDVTERRQAEAARRAAERRMHMAMKLGHIGGWEFDRTTGKGYRTEEQAAILGDDPSNPDWSFGRFMEHVLPEDREAVRQKVEAGMADPAGWAFECRIRRADGAMRWVWVSGGPQPGADRDAGLMAGIVQDITERKLEEAEVRSLEAQLNHLQRLDSVGRLAGGVAHDMNNLLGAIMAVGSLLQIQHPDDPSIQGEAATLLQAASRGRDLVKALRDFSRKELESPAELDLNALVRHEAGILERTTLKKVAVRLDLEEPLPRIVGDAGRLANALLNLCTNACDAMPAGGTLSLATRCIGDRFLELSVQDDGQGMTREVLARAMDPFFTTKPTGQGTGLGLSQVYGTVKAHGGTLGLQSQPGQGTRVTLTLPLVGGLPPPAPASVERTGRPGRPLRILLVDDEPLIREGVVQMLRAMGHLAEVATGGPEALAMLTEGLDPDLVILDLSMPGMDGAETLEHLRSRHPGLRVLIATGYADERVPRLLDRHPDVRFLMKPFDLGELASVLANWG